MEVASPWFKALYQTDRLRIYWCHLNSRITIGCHLLSTEIFLSFPNGKSFFQTQNKVLFVLIGVDYFELSVKKSFFNGPMLLKKTNSFFLFF